MAGLSGLNGLSGLGGVASVGGLTFSVAMSGGGILGATADATVVPGATTLLNQNNPSLNTNYTFTSSAPKLTITWNNLSKTGNPQPLLVVSTGTVAVSVRWSGTQTQVYSHLLGSSIGSSVTDFRTSTTLVVEYYTGGRWVVTRDGVQLIDATNANANLGNVSIVRISEDQKLGTFSVGNVTVTKP